MKPLLSAPLTLEDFEIFRTVCYRFGNHRELRDTCIESFSILADRRDAALMLRLASPCPSCRAAWDHWLYFWSEQDGGSVWQRCEVCGNIRSASNITNFA